MVDSKSRSAKYLTKDDIALMQEKVLLLLENKAKNEIFWQNDDSGNRGEITKAAEFVKKGQPCHRIVFTNYFKGQQEILKEVMCKDKDDLWQVL